MFIDVWLTCRIQFLNPPHPHKFSFHLSVTCGVFVRPCVSLWHVRICHFSPSSGSMSTQCHRGATLNTCLAHTEECCGVELKVRAYIIIVSLLLFISCFSPRYQTRPLALYVLSSSALLNTHIHKHIAAIWTWKLSPLCILDQDRLEQSFHKQAVWITITLLGVDIKALSHVLYSYNSTPCKLTCSVICAVVLVKTLYAKEVGFFPSLGVCSISREYIVTFRNLIRFGPDD